MEGGKVGSNIKTRVEEFSGKEFELVKGKEEKEEGFTNNSVEEAQVGNVKNNELGTEESPNGKN